MCRSQGTASKLIAEGYETKEDLLEIASERLEKKLEKAGLNGKTVETLLNLNETTRRGGDSKVISFFVGYNVFPGGFHCHHNYTHRS